MNDVYMVRAFGTGTGFGPQVLLVLVALVLTGWDCRRHRRWDYGWVLLVGSLVWTAVELTLQLSGTRIMPERTLLGISLPRLVSVPLQGAAEGGAIAVIGLFLGDGWRQRGACAAAIGWLVVLCGLSVLPLLLHAGTVREVTSRRSILGASSVLSCLVLVGTDVALWCRWPALRSRAAAMWSALVLLGTSWTVAAYLGGGRWIEVAGPVPGTYTRAALAGQALGLGYDVVIEIACAYVAFLALPAMLGLLSDDKNASERTAPSQAAEYK